MVRLRKLRLLSLEDRRLISDVVFFYKVVNNHVRLTLDSRVRFSRDVDRGYALRSMDTTNLLTSLSRTNLLPPQGFGPEGKTRGGTLGFPACIHIRNFKSKKVSTISKFVVYGKKSRFDQTRRARSSRVIF